LPWYIASLLRKKSRKPFWARKLSFTNFIMVVDRHQDGRKSFNNFNVTSRHVKSGRLPIEAVENNPSRRRLAWSSMIDHSVFSYI
jgi:hypothetical protein